MVEVNSSTPKIKRGWIVLGICLAFLIGLFVFVKNAYGGLIKAFLYPPTENVNILIMGKGGVGHEAPDLTDTVIFASVSDKKVVLISLSRDIWVPEIRAKLNSAYYWGKFPLAKSTVEKIVGRRVDYGLVIDFSGFKNIIDALGGIEVDVKNSFTDEKYPVPGKEADPCIPCRYEIIKFEKGMVYMDGETALKFVRSRNAQGDEGTDSARAARQQLVIDSISAKILRPEVMLNPRKLTNLKNALLGSIETDIDIETFFGLLRLISSSKGNLSSYSIPEEYLINPPISKKHDSQYVFIPRAENWEEVQKWITTIVD
jgi:LCP family protein required for cell wall assembly